MKTNGRWVVPTVVIAFVALAAAYYIGQLRGENAALRAQVSTLARANSEASAATAVQPASGPAEDILGLGPKDKTAGAASSASGDIVYITRTGKRYHAAGCPSLSRSQIPISREDAIARGYTPCARCNP